MKTSFPILSLCLLTFLLVSCENTLDQDYSDMLDQDLSKCKVSTVDDVVQFVESEWMSNNDYDITISKEPYKSKSDLGCNVLDGNQKTPNGMNWVIGVDLAPGAFLMHPFIYRFVNAKTGKVIDIDGHCYPSDLYTNFILYKKADHSIMWDHWQE